MLSWETRALVPEALLAQAASKYPHVAHVLKPLILRELHSLLWTSPRTGDHGWNCRDQALVTAGLLGLEGKRAKIRHGRCMYVQGATEELPPVGLGQELASAWGHTWLGLKSVGHLDVSVKLDLREGPWRPMRHLGLVGEEWWAEGPHPHDFLVCHSAGDYAREIAAASRLRDRVRAVYLLELEEPFDMSVLRDPFPWTNSPLSNKLKKGHRSPTIYLKLLAHLSELASGKGRPLATVSWDRAWSIIDSRSDAVARRIEEELGSALANA